MSQAVKKHTWVELYNIILKKDQRAPQVPPDTQRVPLEMKVKGFLVEDALVGEQATIITPIGRKITGTLIEINSPHIHTFGHPIPELMPIGREVKAVLRGKKESL